MRITRSSIRSIPLAAIYTVTLAALTLLGFGLRLFLLDRFPLREDEAIYSVWAIHALREDPLFLRVWPDKPPLFLWLLAGAFEFFGSSQAAARLPNIFVGALMIPLVAAVARKLWGRRAALLGALALSLNPFAISFAPTAFTDPLLVFAGMCALWCTLSRRGFWAGFWLGIAIMTKQQGLFYAPLIVAVLWMLRQPQGQRPPTVAGLRSAPAWRFCVGLLLVIGPLLFWDSLRWQVAPSPWDLGVRNYGALALLPPNAWPARLQAWADLAWHLTASWSVWVALLLGGVAILFRPMVAEQGRTDPQPRTHPVALSPAFVIALWSSAFFAVHVITTVQVWDRYLLPLAPMIALGAAWFAAHWLERRHAPHVGIVLVGALMLLMPPAVTAARGGLPIGGDHGDYDGLNEAFAWLRQTAPDDAVLYHRSLGWHAQFYLSDAVERGDFELRWFPHAVYLADNATKLPHRRKWLVQPEWAPVRDLAQQAQVRGLALSEAARFGRFAVYELAQPPQPACDWCVCRVTTPLSSLTDRADPMTQWPTWQPK